jgi:hypothetical protein
MQVGDSHYWEMHEKLNLKTTPEQDRACFYLEGKCLRFLVEFGTDNAIEKARALRTQAKLTQGPSC